MNKMLLSVQAGYKGGEKARSCWELNPGYWLGPPVPLAATAQPTKSLHSLSGVRLQHGSTTCTVYIRED